MITFFLLVFASVSAFATSDIKCEASYDQLGITHQKVTNLEEFYYCFGYHHAKDRAWEMDYFRRVAQGRNAEVYGFSWLKSDLMMRLLDLPTLARRLYDGLSEEQKKWLQAYTDGANLGFETGKSAREFRDKNYLPEPWQPEHSILVLTLQSFDQTRKSFIRDYEEEKLKEHWKEKTEDLFNEDDVPWLSTILKKGEYPALAQPPKTSYNPPGRLKLWANFPEVFGKESGSNNWVVQKSKSRTGHAMLANDPHLDLKTPLFWYWMHLEAPNVSAIGATLPGVPVFASGTNGKVAWGLTNAYINTADVVYIKDLKNDDLVSFRPTIKVKFGFLSLPFFFKKFEKTKNGQLVLPLELQSQEKLILRWSGFSLQSEHLAPMFNLIHTGNVTEMDETLKQVGLPAWNFVFADTKGDVGYRVVGLIYKDHGKDPYGISHESFQQFQSKNFLDPMERPHVLKPKRHYVYTANNRHWPSDAKFYGGRGYSYSFRGFRIEEMLKSEKHDVESFKNIQCDRQAVDARFFVPKLLSIVDIPELKNWDFSTNDDSLATSIYRRLMDLLMDGWQVNEYALFKLLDHLTEQQKSEVSSFYNVAKDQVAGRTWASLHRLSFPHLSKNGEWKFSPEIPGVGDNHSVDPGTAKWDADRKLYDHYSGASMRMIVVMKERPEIYLNLPGLNRTYTEQNAGQTPAWAEWRTCLYHQVKW